MLAAPAGFVAWMVPAQALDAYVSMTLVIWVGIVILALLLASGSLTLGKSIAGYYADRRREAVEDAGRNDLHDRLGSDETSVSGQSALSTWADSLSETEREVLVDLVREHARMLLGSERRRLIALAEELGLREEATTAIETGSRYDRLRGLSLLIAFDWAVDPEWLVDHVGTSRAEREAAIRVLGIDPSEDDRWMGIDASFAGGNLSVYGVDALFELLRADPSPLLTELSRREIADPGLQAQALLVVGHAETALDSAAVEGVVDLLDSDHATVRARACLALANYGWRTDLRDAVDTGALVADPDPDVRLAAYRMLGAWDDTTATDELIRAAQREDDPRAKLTALRELGEDSAWVTWTDIGPSPTERLRRWAEAGDVLEPKGDPLC